VVCYFFFSSRRRHTRSKRYWSSDVCSSDLGVGRDNRRVYVSPETLTIVFTGVGLLFAIAGGFAWVVSRVDGAIVALSLKTDEGKIGRASCRERVEGARWAGWRKHEKRGV